MTKVLVIEPDNGPGGLSPALQGAGFTVFKEMQSSDGLRTAVVEEPRIIIVDENMPPIDGMELMSLLKSYTDSLIMVKCEDGTVAPANAQPVDTQPSMLVSGLLLRSPADYSSA